MTTAVAWMALTLVLIEMVLSRLAHRRLRHDVALGNLDAYRALSDKIRDLTQKYEAMEVRLRDQELRP